MAIAASLDSLSLPAPTPSGADRRTSARSRLFTLVRTSDDLGPMWAWDIGLGGLLCRAKRPRFPGTYLDVTLTLPGTSDTLCLGAQVLTLDEHAEGVALSLRFCRPNAAARLAIYRFLDRRRAMWEPDVSLTPQQQLAQRHPELAHVFSNPEPFKEWLMEAKRTAARSFLQRVLGWSRS